MGDPRVSVVILNWNGLQDTVECIDSLRGVSYSNYETIVVDNGSTGDDVKALREKYGDTVFIFETGENLGFFKGLLAGVDCAVKHGTDYVLLCQNDMVFDAAFLKELIGAVKEEHMLGIASPVIYWYDRPDVLQHGPEKASWFGLRSTKVRPTGSELTESISVQPICMLMRGDKIEDLRLKDLAEKFVLIGDPHWCLHALRAGLKLAYAPGSVVWHKGSRSLARAGSAAMLGWTSRDYVTMQLLLFKSGYSRHMTATQFTYYVCHTLVYRLPVYAFRVMRNLRPATAVRLCRGLRAGLRPGTTKRVAS